MANTSGMLKQLTLALVAVMGANVAAAQPLLPPTPFGEGEELIERPMASEFETAVAENGRLNPFSLESTNYETWDSGPAVVDSSGTWRDRGVWFSEIEAVVLVRQWNRQRLELMSDSTATLRELSLGRSTPGREGSVRFTLGRFLFRDGENNDHRMEFTLLGGGEFGQNSSVMADLNAGSQGLQVNPAVDNFAAASFDGAESSFVQYDSRLNSFELNYTINSRLKRDRMELLPTGQWVRRANSGLTYEFLGGVRYIDLTENLDWTAENIVDGGSGGAAIINGETGEYLIRTSNDVFGLQGGFGCAYSTPRFSIESLCKLGVLANALNTKSSLTFTDPATNTVRTDVGWDDSNRTDTLSLLTEFSLVGRYQVKPNIHWRAGYHMLLVSHVALAPHQADFSDRDASIASTGDVFYHGISTGIDFFW